MWILLPPVEIWTRNTVKKKKKSLKNFAGTDGSRIQLCNGTKKGHFLYL